MLKLMTSLLYSVLNKVNKKVYVWNSLVFLNHSVMYFTAIWDINSMIHSDVVMRGLFFLKLSINADGVKQTLRDNVFIELVMECHYLYIYL